MKFVSTAQLNPNDHPEATRGNGFLHSLFSRCLYALLFVSIVGTGVYTSGRAADHADKRIRARLLQQAREIARSIDPELGRSLRFTAEDLDLPNGQRLRAHLHSYQAASKPRGIYTLAQRGNDLVFGVESYLPEDKFSSPPGTAYQQPPREVRDVFQRKMADAVFGPVRDEYGTFVTALAPVLDSRTGDLILAVGVDLAAADWASAVRAASLPPLWGAGLAVLILGTGLSFRNRYRDASAPPVAFFRTETLFSMGAGLLLTFLTTSLLLQTERNARQSDFDTYVTDKQIRLIQSMGLASRKLKEAEALYSSRVNPSPDEFSSFLGPSTSETSLRFFAWIPETHLTDRTPGADPAPPGPRPYVWPASETDFILGEYLDNPETVALLRKAAEETQAFASRPRPFPGQSQKMGLIYLVRYLPPSGPEGSRGIRHGGWLVVGMEPRRALQNLENYEFMDSEPVCLCLIDVSQSLESPVHIHLTTTENDEPDCEDRFTKSLITSRQLTHLSPLFLFDRTYVLYSYPTPFFLLSHPPRATKVAGAAGLVFTCLLTLLVILLRHRQSDLERGILAKTAEAREREENLSVTLQSIGDGVIVADVADRIIRMNPAAERWTGWSQEEANGLPLTRVYQLDLSASGVLNLPAPRPGAPSLLRTRDGRSLPVIDSVAPIRNEAGERIGRIVVFQDITELRDTQQALENSEQQYQLLFDGLVSGFALHEVITNAEGKPVDYRYLKINSVLEKQLGREAKEVVGRTVMELFPETESFWIESLGQVALTGQPAHLDHMNSALNRYWDVVAYCPKPGQFATLVTDITERRRLEEERYRLDRSLQQKQRLESLGVLAGGIAHDFNNILTVILGNAELIRNSLPAASPSSAPLKDITSAARTAADLCRQMLAYAGRGRYVIEPLDLNRVVTEMEPILKTVATKNGKIHYRLAPSVPAIEGDVSQFRQIILNLALNAAEAFRDGQGAITISTGAQLCTTRFLRELNQGHDLPEGLYVFFEVSDNGCGMSPDVLNRIFDPFFTTKFTGRGLGLAAVLGIVHGHHGGLSVASEPGRGTTFKAFFPAVGDSFRPQGQPLSNLTRKPLWVDRKTVLLADPDLAARKVGRHLLEQIGVQPLTASSGADALAFFREYASSISCAMLDLRLNERDGDNWAEAILKIRPDLPILFSGVDDLRRAPPGCPPGGQYGFLLKPYDINSLIDALNPLLVQPADYPPGKPTKPSGKF